jgi:hypothetical protein
LFLDVFGLGLARYAEEPETGEKVEIRRLQPDSFADLGRAAEFLV